MLYMYCCIDKSHIYPNVHMDMPAWCFNIVLHQINTFLGSALISTPVLHTVNNKSYAMDKFFEFLMNHMYIQFPHKYFEQWQHFKST